MSIESLKKHTEIDWKNNDIVILLGRYGIGKNFAVNKALKDLQTENIIKIEGVPDDKSAHTTLYRMLDNYKQSLPTGESYFLFPPTTNRMQDGNKAGDSVNTRESPRESLGRFGIDAESGHAKQLFNLIQSIQSIQSDKSQISQTSHDRKILYCTNIQCFDEVTLNLIIELLKFLPECNWTCIITCTAVEETKNEKISYDKKIFDIPQGLVVKEINFEYRKLKEVRELCDSILGFPLSAATVNPTERLQILLSEIYKHSHGLPLYIKCILNILKEQKYIIRYEEQYILSSKLENLKLSSILAGLEEDILKNIYKKVNGSKDILQIGSVFSSEFTPQAINIIKGGVDNVENLFHATQACNQIIRYLKNDNWIFSNILIKKHIRKLLGNSRKYICIKIGEYYYAEKNYLAAEKYFVQGGEISKSYTCIQDEIIHLLNIGYIKSAKSFFDKRKELDSITFKYNNSFKFLEGRIIFHEKGYLEASKIFEELSKCEEDSKKQGLYKIWHAKTLLKSNSQADFDKALIIIKTIKIDKSDAIYGDLQLELMIAIAHLNKREEAHEIYKATQKVFSDNNDEIGLLRLKRRSIIFLEAKVSTRLLFEASQRWAELKVQPEQLMCLNNLAVQMIILEDYKYAQLELEKAKEISKQINYFGMHYVCNNLAILLAIEGDCKNARIELDTAASLTKREVECIIIRGNLSIIDYIEKKGDAEKSLLAVYKEALTTKENAYIVPTSINLAICYKEKENYDTAIELLLFIEDKIPKHQINNRVIWYEALYSCYTQSNKADELLSLRQKYKEVVDEYKINYKSEINYAYIALNFWGDN